MRAAHRRWMVGTLGVCLAVTGWAQTTLKIATMAPDGSIWMQALADAKTEVEAATGGAVKLKIYPGGIMGSEKDVLFKIKTGQLQGGGFMGYAIGKICPDASALMFPMVFHNYAEVDQALPQILPYLDAHAAQNGFESMGWTEVGFSYAYSTKPIANLDEFRVTKVWGLDSPMLTELLLAAGVSFIPANITDVLTSLQTGLLETVFGPPAAAIAVQWHTKVRYYNEMQLTYAIGGVFVSSASWATVPPQHRDAVKAVITKHCQLLTPKVRNSDIEALDFMRKQGVQALAETPAARAAFDDVASSALNKIKGTLFSDEVWERLQSILRDIRSS